MRRKVSSVLALVTSEIPAITLDELYSESGRVTIVSNGVVVDVYNERDRENSNLSPLTN